MLLKLPARTCFIAGPTRCGKTAALAAVLRSHVHYVPEGELLLLIASKYEEQCLRDYIPDTKEVLEHPRLMIVRPDAADALRGHSPQKFSTLIIAQSSVLQEGTTVRYYEPWTESAVHFMNKLNDQSLFPYIVAVTHLSENAVDNPINR